MTSQDIVKKYLAFFEKRGHKQIPNAPLIPENDPTTLFTSSGMQPLVPYLLGEPHPQGKRLVNVQNSFRAQDIDEVGDNRHTTFFRMLGNWSLGEYFKKEQLPWFFEFLTQQLKLDPRKLYVTIFGGDEKFKVFENGKYQPLRPDVEAADIWTRIFEEVGIQTEIANISTREKPDINQGRIFYYGADKNWWSRVGTPEQMPIGEIGGPDSEVFYDFGQELKLHESTEHKKETCHPNCQCGRFIEIGNSVFMQYKKVDDHTFEGLPSRNVDFGGGLERLLAVAEHKQDMFQTTLFAPIIKSIEIVTGKHYQDLQKQMRVIADHLIAATFIIANDVTPSNKEQGYVLRRLIRRGLDNFYQLKGDNVNPILVSIVEQYKATDPELVEKFEKVKLTILEEQQIYQRTLHQAKQFIQKKYRIGDELMGVTEISSDDAFLLYTTHGLSPTQIRSLGFTFDDQAFAEKMKEHQKVSRAGATQRFAGGLADHSEATIKGHTATHLLHQALRDVLGTSVHQTGSNITPERVRFDFSYNKKLTDEELKRVEEIVNEKIDENLPVHFEMMTVDEAKKTGAIGLFDEKYGEKVKVYFVGNYSKEFCGGPHVDFTGRLKKFTIKKVESLGKGQRRIYAVVQ